MRVNLDARRAEANLESHVVTVGGVDYELPPAVPVVIGQYLVEGRTADAVAVLFGAQHLAAVAPYIGIDELFTMVRELYGFAVGESAASPTPSSNGGAPSRPTSFATTAAT